ncbi:MAG: right-handed parallel beta-helix repeat-containing protein [Deltaproteobacteria bacterium]|nr:right-handed parallel beta-helix repeat-containing protein [Deltaproteobacteria bacterium]
MTVYRDSVAVGTEQLTGGATDFSITTAALGDGTFHITVTATDAAQNPSYAVTVDGAYEVDTTAPAAPTGVAIAPSSPSNDETPTVTGEAEANALVTIYQDGASVGTEQLTGGATAFSITTTALGEGTYNITATATDATGNEGLAATADATYRVDLSTPEPPTGLAGQPTHVSGTNASVTLTWTGSVNSAGDLNSYKVYGSADGGTTWGSNAPAFDDGLGIDISPALTWYQVSGLAAGQTRDFKITACDAATNESAGATVSVTITGEPSEVVTLSGTLAGDTSLGPGVYVISSDLTVPAGLRLDISPGAILKFQESSGLYVDGDLVAVGTGVDPIVFTAWTDDEWGGDNNGDGPSNGSPGYWTTIEMSDSVDDVVSNLEEILVRYSGSGNSCNVYLNQTSMPLTAAMVKHGTGYGICTYDASPIIDGCVVDDMTDSGILLRYGAPTVTGSSVSHATDGIEVRYGTPTIDDNLITNNSGYGVYHLDARDAPVMQGNTITGNAVALMIPTSALPDDTNVLTPNAAAWIGIRGNIMQQDGRLSVLAEGQPEEVRTYRIYDGHITVPDGLELVIDPGVVLKYSSGVGMQVYGDLVVDGTADDKVVFTAFDDHSSGDPTDSDLAVLPEQGAWFGVELDTVDDPFRSVIRHARFLYGGSNGSGALYLYRSPITVEDSEFSRSWANGIRIYESDASVARIDAWGNLADGVRIEQGASDATVTDSCLSSNLSDGIEATAGTLDATTNSYFGQRGFALRSSVAVDASGSWWGEGDGTGPYNATTNPSGQGGEVSDLVAFAPYETQAEIPWAYINLSASNGFTAGTLPAPFLTQGTPSDEWGMSADRSMAWHADSIFVDFTGLDPASDYTMRTSWFSGDVAPSRIRVTDSSGNPVVDQVILPHSTPVQTQTPIPPAYYAGGTLTLEFINDNPATSFRVAVTEVWLFSGPP